MHHFQDMEGNFYIESSEAYLFVSAQTHSPLANLLSTASDPTMNYPSVDDILKRQPEKVILLQSWLQKSAYMSVNIFLIIYLQTAGK